MFLGNVGYDVFGSTDSLNYAANDGTCDHIWVTTLTRNAPLNQSSHDYTHNLHRLAKHARTEKMKINILKK